MVIFVILIFFIVFWAYFSAAFFPLVDCFLPLSAFVISTSPDVLVFVVVALVLVFKFVALVFRLVVLSFKLGRLLPELERPELGGVKFKLGAVSLEFCELVGEAGGVRGAGSVM
jgi:hypothetical protein